LLLEEDYELQAKLGYPLKVSSDDSEIAVIKRVTGRIPLLTIQEQEDLYTLIETETQELIAQKEAMGESVLRADQLDLEARAIARMEVIPDNSGIESEFTGSVSLEVVDAKVAVKPLTQLQVINAVREQLELTPVSAVSEHDFGAVEAIAYEFSRSAISTIQQATNRYRREALLNAKSESGRDKLNARLDEQLLHLQRVFQAMPPGTTVQVISPEGNVFYGVVSRFIQKSQNGSPAAPTNWKAEILIVHRSRQLIIPLTKFNRGREDSANLITRQASTWNNEPIYESFDLRQTQNQRMEVQIFTGNPIKAYEKFPKGKFVNYTNDQGEVLQGLVMPASFDIQEALREQPVAFYEAQQVKAFLTEVTRYQGSVKTLDELLTIKPQASARFNNTNATGFILQTLKSSIGDQYSLDEAIIQAAGAEFYSVSDRMECIVPKDRIDSVLTVILNEKHWTLAAFDFKDEARKLLNIKLPEFSKVEVMQKEIEKTFNSTIPKSTQNSNANQQSEPAPVPHDWRTVDRSELTPAALNYLQLKDQNPEALIFVRSRSGEFYEAYFSDANTISEALALMVIYKDMGNSAPHSPSLMIPARPGVLNRFTGYLQEQGFTVIVQEGRETASPDRTQLREQVDRVRDSELTEIAARLGLEQDRHDPHKWRNEHHTISITEQKFKDWTTDVGGGGAIDLVMHVQKVDFRTAVEWLSGQALPQIIRQRQTPQKLELPPAQESNWATVRQYLVNDRGLPEDWIDRLHEKGLIYADAQRNAVFLRHADSQEGQLWSRGHPTGANLRGTGEQPFHGLAPGTAREQGWFWLRHGKAEIERIVLVESAIDALSLAALEREKGQKPGGTVYLSTDGAGAIPVKVLRSHLENGGQVIVAFDADKAGEKLAWRVAQEVLGVQRMTPAICKDWNDRLLAEKHPERQTVSERGDKETLKMLWKWYRVSAAVGQSEAYRQRITEVAREFVDGKSLSENAIAAMEKDFQRSNEQTHSATQQRAVLNQNPKTQDRQDIQALGE
jgi:Toprim-like/Protein of unknown function (DUF3991)/MutS domain I